MPPPFSDGDTMGKTLVVSGQQHRRSFAPCRKKQNVLLGHHWSDSPSEYGIECISHVITHTGFGWIINLIAGFNEYRWTMINARKTTIVIQFFRKYFSGRPLHPACISMCWASYGIPHDLRILFFPWPCVLAHRIQPAIRSGIIKYGLERLAID